MAKNQHIIRNSQEHQMAVTFSGNHAKAEDVIAKGVATSGEW
jgi:hypothetical protein